MKALFDYSAAETNELSFKEGDIVMIINRVEGSDWCKAKLNGKAGNFENDLHFVIFVKRTCTCELF